MPQSQMQAEREADSILGELKAEIQQDWPPEISEVAVCIHDYFQLRAEFTLQNGLR